MSKYFGDLMNHKIREDKMLLKLLVNSQNVQSPEWTKFFNFFKFSRFLKCSKFKSCQITILKYSYVTKWCNHMNSCHSKDFKLVLKPYDAIWYNHIIVLWKCKDKNENARTKMKMQGQKGKCKDNIKSYSLDRFEQVEWSKTNFWKWTSF